MYWLTLIELSGVSLFSAYIIQVYCNKEVSLFVKFVAWVAWVMNFAIIGFVPLDIYITMRNADAGTDPINDPAYINLANIYQLLYWGLFLMCWTLIPILSEYVSAVDFDPNDKLKRSLKNNLKFILMISIVGILFLVYIIWSGTASEYGLNTFLKTLANSYGIALIIGLLGYSIITIPRAHMRTAQFDVQIRYLYFRTATLSQEKKDAKHTFEEDARKIFQIKDYKYENVHFQSYIQLSLELIPMKIQRNLQQETQRRRSSFFNSLQQPQYREDAPQDIEEMMELYQSLKVSHSNLTRIKAALKQHLKQCFKMEDIMKCRYNDTKRIDFAFKKPRSGSTAHCRDTWDWYWLCHLKPRFKILLSFTLGLMSVLVFVQEVTLFMSTNFTIFGLPLQFTENFIVIQFATFIPLLYIAFCVYYGMFRIKISGFYGLYPDHQTDAASLFFTTINFSRVSAPLCLNYLNIIRLKHQTAFNYVMGNIELNPVFGISFTKLFPVFLIVLCLFNYFDIYDRMMKFLGMKQFIFAQNFSDRLIYEGKDYTRQSRMKWLTKWYPSQELQVVSDMREKLLSD